MCKQIPKRSYPSKILLFGEYTVLTGGKAFAIPYHKFSGTWKSCDRPFQNTLDQGFIQYLKTYRQLKDKWHKTRFEKMMDSHIYFESNIPEGYGLGSSASLTAAIYDLIVLNKSKNPVELKEELSWIESYYHGSSSGIDPLVSYLDQAVIIYEQSITTKSTWIKDQTPFHIFLIDSLQKRSTSEFVRDFLTQVSDHHFRDKIESELNPLFETCINLLTTQKDPRALWKSWMQISQFQFQYFQKMIPENLVSLWKQGLNSGLYGLKLCGAGGGVFFLGLKGTDEWPDPLQSWPIIDLY